MSSFVQRPSLKQRRPLTTLILMAMAKSLALMRWSSTSPNLKEFRLVTALWRRFRSPSIASTIPSTTTRTVLAIRVSGWPSTVWSLTGNTREKGLRKKKLRGKLLRRLPSQSALVYSHLLPDLTVLATLVSSRISTSTTYAVSSRTSGAHPGNHSSITSRRSLNI